MLMLARADRLARRIGVFGADRRGVSAVEFALIAPILILMYFAMADLSSALMAQRRANHATASVGDLAAQFAAMDPTADVPSTLQSGQDIMAPFAGAPLQMRISSLIVDGSAQKLARVNWSCAPSTNTSSYAALAAGTPATLPSGIVSNTGDSVIMVESTYAYNSPALNVVPNTFNFPTTVYYRPRQTAEVILQWASGAPTPTYTYTPWVSTSASNSYTYTAAANAGVPSIKCYYQSG